MDSCRPRKIPHRRLSCHCSCSMTLQPIEKIRSIDQAHYLTHLFVALVCYRHEEREKKKKRARVSIPRGTEREGAATATVARAAILQSRPRQNIVGIFGERLSQRVCTHILGHADTVSLCMLGESIQIRVGCRSKSFTSFTDSDIFKERGIAPILSPRLNLFRTQLYLRLRGAYATRMTGGIPVGSAWNSCKSLVHRSSPGMQPLVTNMLSG